MSKQLKFLSDPIKAAEKAQFDATVGNLLEKYGSKDKDKDKGQQEQQDPLANPPAEAEPIPGEEPKRKPMTRGKKDTIKGGAAIARSHRGR